MNIHRQIDVGRFSLLMYRGTLIRCILCIAILSIFLYCYIDKQNDLTELRLEIPTLAKEVKALCEENSRLRYEVERFENPENLLELARRPEFSHLKHPLVKEILTCQEGIALHTPSDEEKTEALLSQTPKPTLAFGASH
jgi:cell division protein FtsL